MAFLDGVYFSTSTGYIASWDPNSHQVNVVANTGMYFTDIAFSPNGSLYGITFDSLYQIDSSTGNAQLVGQMTGSLFVGNNGITGGNGFDISDDGVGFVTSFDNQVIAQVDLQTGAVQNAGLLSYSTSAGDIAIVGDTAYVSTTSYNIQEFDRVYVNGQPTAQWQYSSNSTFVASNELFGLVPVPIGQSGFSSLGLIAFDQFNAYDIGVPGAVLGPGLLDTFSVPGGFISGAAIQDAGGGVVQLPPPALTSTEIFAIEGKLGFLSQLALASYKLVGTENQGAGLNDYKQWSENAYNGYTDTKGVWHDSVWQHIDPLTSSDLPNLNTNSTSFGTNGINGGIFTNQNAAALVGRSADSLFIAFRGTNDRDQMPNSPDHAHWGEQHLSMSPNKQDHFSLFQQLMSEINNYIAANPEVTSIYVTGHSLGGSMVEAFMDQHPGVNIEAVTFANPGYGFELGSDDSRITNLIIKGDPIWKGSPFGDNEGDKNKIIHDQDRGDYLHSMKLYAQYAEFLEDSEIYAKNLGLSGVGQVGLHGFDYDKIYTNFKIIDEQNQIFEIATGQDTISGSIKNDIILGGDGKDTLSGKGGHDHIDGGGWKDTLIGGSGKDFLFGRGGKDTLKGGIGADTLDGGGGADTLIGGSGADTFVFEKYSNSVSGRNFNIDTVFKFSDWKDSIDLTSFGFQSVKEAKSYASNRGGDTVFDFGGGDVLILDNFHKSDLDSGDFIL